MKIGMIFPGYASQFVGMGKELYDESRIMQEYFEEASHCLDINFIKLCFASSDLELSKMQHAYTSLFLISSSIYAMLAESGITPDVIAGYNTGQFAAMHAAKGLTFPDGLYVLTKLSLYAQELVEQQQVALARIKGCSHDELEALIKRVEPGNVHIAFYEMPNQHIISGAVDAIDACIKQIQEFEKVKVTTVPIEYGLHTRLMDPVVEQFKVYLEKVDFKDVEVPVIVNTTAQQITSGEALKQEVIEHATKPVLWLQTMQALHTCDIIISVGPGNMLSDMLKQLYPNKPIMTVQKSADIQTLKNMIHKDQQHEEQVIEQEQVGT